LLLLLLPPVGLEPEPELPLLCPGFVGPLDVGLVGAFCVAICVCILVILITDILSNIRSKHAIFIPNIEWIINKLLIENLFNCRRKKPDTL
jgi:hypothetical protein